jgi:hypothetical protein
MIKKIIAYGDSFVQGGGLNPDDTMAIHPDSWPFQLGKKLGVPVSNRAKGGSSNKLSIVRLMEDASNGLLTNDTLVIFAWTGIQRTTFYNSEKNEWQDLLIGHKPKSADHLLIHKLYYEKMYSDYDCVLQIFQQQMFVDLYLKWLGVKHFFVNSFAEFSYLPIAECPVKLADDFKENFLLGYTNSLLLEIVRTRGLVCSDTYHPSLEGHTLIADMMVEYIKDRGIND